MTPGFVLGLDGGGSKTELAVADVAGNLLAFERGAGLDPLSDPRWEDGFRELLGRCAVLLPKLRAAVLALPAHGEVAEVSARQAEAAARALPTAPTLLNDVHAAQVGAFAGGPGVLLLAGTGSMAWTVDPLGRSSRVGGWGEAFGDEGSAHWVGREALALATQALDGRSGERDFALGLLDRIGVEAGGLLGWLCALPNRRAGIAALAAVVDGMAEQGDAAARDLLLRAADHLVNHVRAAGSATAGGLPWSYAGGLFNSGTVSLRTTAQLGPPRPPTLPPVGGSLLHAARAAGWPGDGAWMARLAADLDGGATRH